MKSATITGAGGAIGGHLTRSLLSRGYEVHAIDIKPSEEWFQVFDEATNDFEVDLSHEEGGKVIDECDELYALACRMGGIGEIIGYPTDALESIRISTTHRDMAKSRHIPRVFYSSSACACSSNLQQSQQTIWLKESDVWQGPGEEMYGIEKLMAEEAYKTAANASDKEGGPWFDIRIARFHNIFGTFSSYDGGKEKAPAAICRKVAEAVISKNHEIEIWGTGEQTRSFLYVDECVEGIRRIMDSDYSEPLNLGSDELVSINQLVDMVEQIANCPTLERKYNLGAPVGVMGRNSDNTKIKEVLDWAPSSKLYDGLVQTYEWVFEQVANDSRLV